MSIARITISFDTDLQDENLEDYIHFCKRFFQNSAPDLLNSTITGIYIDDEGSTIVPSTAASLAAE